MPAFTPLAMVSWNVVVRDDGPGAADGVAVDAAQVGGQAAESGDVVLLNGRVGSRAVEKDGAASAL